MTDVQTDLVTGAFGFTGSRICERLLAAGRRVRTLSRRCGSGDALAGRVEILRYDFSLAALGAAMEGVDTLYVTYWMRFPRGGATWPEVVQRLHGLVSAAADAGVRRLVYVSVSNAARDSSTAYFRAKAAAEAAVRSGGVSFAIVRPTLLFGEGDILINNMAWTLRRLPVFGVPGNGRYRVQPVYVGDVADLAVALGAGHESCTVEAAGPETFAFEDLVRRVGRAIGRPSRLVHLPPRIVLAATHVMGLAVRDVVLTADEIGELMEGLLTSTAPSMCPTRFSEWLERHGDGIGLQYASELERNFSLA